jgi:hypothetical protein
MMELSPFLFPPLSNINYSYVGYANKEVDVTQRNHFTAALNLAGSTDAMQEVVVVAYGTQQKKNITGAVSCSK